MKLFVDIMNDGVRVDAHSFNVYPGKDRTITVQVDVSHIVRNTIANTIGLPDSTNHPKKEPKRHGNQTSNSPQR